MYFDYNHDTITTIDRIEISVADLRDLVNASTLSNENDKQKEIELILQCIERKNKLAEKSFTFE